VLIEQRKMSAAEAGEALGATRSAIMGAAARYGITMAGSHAPMAHKKRPDRASLPPDWWTPERDSLFRDRIENNMPVTEIAQFMRIGTYALYQRAKVLGLDLVEARPFTNRKQFPRMKKQREASAPELSVLGHFAEGFVDQFGFVQRGQIEIVDMRPRLCKFPIDQQNGSVRYCGRSTPDEREPYCPEHRRRCSTGGVMYLQQERKLIQCQ
jgi:hypothetical protein